MHYGIIILFMLNFVFLNLCLVKYGLLYTFLIYANGGFIADNIPTHFFVCCFIVLI